MKELGAVDGGNVRLTTDSGQVILAAATSKQAPHRRVAFVPYGAWASMLFDPATHASGMPTLKGVKATIEKAPDARVATLKEITRMKAE